MELWSLSLTRFGRALCKALGMSFQLVELELERTWQIGSWSAEAVPVILVFSGSNAQLQSVISQFALRLRRRFILLAPRNRGLDARGHEFLANAQSALFPLDGNVLLTAAGSFQPLKTPGELFARFTPEPKEMEEDVARRAFAIVKQLDSESRMKAPSLLTVFRLYCIEELSAAQIARKFGCGKTTVMDRLKLLRKRTGLEPAALRRISAHLNQIEAQTLDSRASQVRGRKLIYDDEE